ncbi:hypothetical protein F383_12728 [Gossypium arboreum]|uniref:Uncharacterized protein n=1 Tax=Gossypium arboreum TaxID=29729 RepID=A0A0B0PRM8_GOSAR|nr:hypothetical protein F383_12728 [Gossypium arboreum]
MPKNPQNWPFLNWTQLGLSTRPCSITSGRVRACQIDTVVWFARVRRSSPC